MVVMLEPRVIILEDLMAQLTRNVDQVTRNVDRLSAEMAEYKRESRREMAEFKAEMRHSHEEFKAEMRHSHEEFKAEMERSREESRREMAEFKAKMDQSYAEHEKGRIEMRKQWGELSRKLGTMAEDLVAPSVSRIARDVLHCTEEEMELSGVRVKRPHHTDRSRQKEFDVVAVYGDYLFVNETKSRLRPEDIKEFVEITLPEIRDFFPEYRDKKVIGCVASLYVSKDLVKDAERRGLIILGFGTDVMQVLNSHDFIPTYY